MDQLAWSIPVCRHKRGVCIACFRPPLVLNIREGKMVTFVFRNMEMTDVTEGD